MTLTAHLPPVRRSLASFFIARPVFAIVLAIVTMLGGIVGVSTLPVSQYPEIAPTTVRISASYAGASADAVENSVTTVIESAMTGLDGLTYMSANSSTGSGNVTLTFDNSVNPDTAQVQVQNNLAQVENRLPESVRSAGLRVVRSGDSILMIGAIVSKDGQYTTNELADIMSSVVEPRIERAEGVGSLQSFGSGYAMRIWLDPVSLAAYGLTPADVRSAVQSQNVQVSIGSIGSTPVVEGQQLRATITAQSRLQSVEEFQAIILKSADDGSLVRLGEVARVEIGLQSYGVNSRYNSYPAAGFGVQLASGANAINTANAVHAALDGVGPALPDGVEIEYAYETTPFVELSIEKVVHTLIEAIVLVFFVLLIFLQNWRATIIPMIAVPVVLAGTFGVLAILGYSINTLTMFAVVLAIGLLVDDAIVVVENVERIMEEEGLSAREATEKSMGEITGALIGIALVLSAVFVPMAFFAGATGVIYRQFSVTIVSAMALSAAVAIILTPALCAIMLKPKTKKSKLFGWFNWGFGAFTRTYVRSVGLLIRMPLLVIVLFAGLCGGAWWTFNQLSSSFLPEEDQGVLMTMISLPNGANAARTQAVIEMVEHYYLTYETESVESVFTTLGFGFGGGGENSAMAYVRLKDFSERTRPEQKSQAVATRARLYFQQIRDAQVFAVAPPAIQGLGNSSGFSLQLMDTANAGRDALSEASNQLAELAKGSALVTNVSGNAGRKESQLKVEIDQEKARALGVDVAAANSILQIAFSGSYVNDFVMGNEIRPVYVQGDASYRMQPEDIGKWYARNAKGEMVPFSAFSDIVWTEGARGLSRFNGTGSISISGSPAEGVSSGEAMDEMERLVSQLDGGYTAAWSGQSYQERLSGSQAIILYAVSLLVVFLCLAALYESWTIPFSVMLAVPVGILGALLAAYLFGQTNDVYFKVGLLATMGLAAKNAILIVEFAKDLRDQGMTLRDAVMEAARLRLRPIIMTSLAFILGVTPLATATGAGSGAQNAIGIAVLGGMIAATALGIFFVPSFFMLVAGLVDRIRGRSA